MITVQSQARRVRLRKATIFFQVIDPGMNCPKENPLAVHSAAMESTKSMSCPSIQGQSIVKVQSGIHCFGFQSVSVQTVQVSKSFLLGYWISCSCSRPFPWRLCIACPFYTPSSLKRHWPHYTTHHPSHLAPSIHKSQGRQ